MQGCGCIERIKQGLGGKAFPTAEAITCSGIEILSGKTFTYFTVQIPGCKKPKEVPVLHSHCPFCGRRYDAEEGQNA